MDTIDTAPAEDRAANRGLPALADLLIVVSVLIIVKQALLPFTVVFAGPASTLSAMVAASFLLYRRGLSWGDLGFCWPTDWKAAGAWSVAIFVSLLATVAASGAVAGLWFENVGASGRFDFVEGNLAGYLLIMVVVWTHGSFFEELLFRAFIITKLAGVLDRFRGADILALVIAAVFFGYRHFYYQGMHGAIVTGSIGLIFGFFYLRLRKTSILPLIFVHGLTNSIAQTSRYLG